MHPCLVPLLLILCLVGLDDLQPAYAEVSQSYEYYLSEAQDALDRNDYEKALDYFERAHLIAPSAAYPTQRIEQIKNVINGTEDPGRLPAGRLNTKYRLFLGLGKQAFERQDYDLAMRYFETAVQIDPTSQEAMRYINLIKRTNDRRLQKAVATVETEPVIVTPQPRQRPHPNRQAVIERELEIAQRDIARRSATQESSPTARPPLPRAAKALQETPVVPSHPTTKDLRPVKNRRTETITLDEALWSTQPKTILRVEFRSYVVLESRNIDRFLVITPGVVEVERIDRDHLKITALRIGTTYVHIWDERGRWTFSVEVVLPPPSTTTDGGKPEDPEIQYAEPFRFSYAVDGGTLYRGPSIPSARRENLNLQQTLSTVGETPYGTVDASVGFNKFDESTEATSYTVGLSGAQAPGWRDINIRGFDASKYFSALTFPGQYFRGIVLEGKTFGENLGAAYVHGQDRYTYSFLTPGFIEERRSYIEGGRVVLFPNEDNQYGFNFARGYGPARQEFLKDQVYSIDAKHRFQKALVGGEIATNTDNMAETVTSKFNSQNAVMRASFRNIDKDFTTISNPPSNQGETGALLSADWQEDRFEVTSNADIYQEHLLPNAENPDSVNYDLDSTVRIPLTDTLRWSTSGYYLDTPGELSARRNARLLNELTKRYEIWGGRQLETFVGGGYQRSRVSETPISDYDRYSATTGVRIGLLRNLNYYANYEYSWVDNLSSDDVTNPSVWNTGLNYSHQWTERLASNVGFYYRNEENTQGTNSFLAGEDSITGSVGMSYRPTNDSEIFWDSRLRNVWRENPENPAYNEIDVRWGLRSAWDLPVRWNPHGRVTGHLFKDINRNQKRDAEEPGLPNVHLKVGKTEAVTDQNGHYAADIRAKKVLVVPDLSTVPSGYILTTPAVRDIRIPSEGGVDFGFTTDSGIYGVVYFDKNGNKQPDQGDVFIQHARLFLDNKTSELTEYDGTYFFKNVSGGQHTIRLEVNSLPIEYIPLVKVSTTVSVVEGTTYVYHIPLKKKSD